MLQGSFLSQLESYRKETTRLCLSNKQTGLVGGWMVPGVAGGGQGERDVRIILLQACSILSVMRIALLPV